MKIYSKKLFLCRSLVCALVGTWIFYTEKMFWFIVSAGKPQDIVAGMICLHMFWGVCVYLSWIFWQNCENGFWLLCTFLKDIRKAVITFSSIVGFALFQFIVYWVGRFFNSEWGFDNNIIFTAICIVMIIFVGVVACIWGDVFENVGFWFKTFFSWLTGEKEADEFLDHV